MHLIQAVFTVLLAVSPALSAVSEPAATPTYVPNCRGQHGPKNYPNPKQANTYFQCVYGRPIKLWCPSRQLFNAAKGKCEPVKNIDDYPDVDRSSNSLLQLPSIVFMVLPCSLPFLAATYASNEQNILLHSGI